MLAWMLGLGRRVRVLVTYPQVLVTYSASALWQASLGALPAPCACPQAGSCTAGRRLLQLMSPDRAVLGGGTGEQRTGGNSWHSRQGMAGGSSLPKGAEAGHCWGSSPPRWHWARALLGENHCLGAQHC